MIMRCLCSVDYSTNIFVQKYCKNPMLVNPKKTLLFGLILGVQSCCQMKVRITLIKRQKQSTLVLLTYQVCSNYMYLLS